MHFSAFVDLATEISAILPRWRLKLSVYFHLGEYCWKDFSSPAKAAKLSTCSPQAGVRNYYSVELSFLYRGITSKKKNPKPEISSFCSRNLDDQPWQQSLPTTTRKLRRCRTRTGDQRASHLRHYTTALVSQAFAVSLALKDFTQTITL